jgi:signal transduction histidine kinase
MGQESHIKQEDLLRLLEKDRLQTMSLVAGEILRRIKEPVSLIRGRAEALVSQLQYYQRENAQGILDQVFQLETLVHSVENILRPRADLDQVIRPYELLEEVISFFHLRLAAGKIQFMNMLLPELEVQGSPSTAKQVLVPLLVNAIEALEEKKGDLKTVFVQYQNRNKHHVLTIEDNGAGISAETLQSIFNSLESRKKGHLGLSLSICKKMCESNGWKLKAFSQEGHGTRMELWIPQSS